MVFPEDNTAFSPEMPMPEPRGANASTDTLDLDDWVGMVCTVHVSGESDQMLFKCRVPGCEGRSARRWAEFDRHYKGAHAAKATKYWCTQTGCNRSEAKGNRPFPRRDKKEDHVRKMHTS